MKMFPTTIKLIGLPFVLLTALTWNAGAAAPKKDATKKSATSFEFNKKDPIYITADWMEADQSKNSITYKGRVVTVQNEMLFLL